MEFLKWYLGIGAGLGLLSNLTQQTIFGIAPSGGPLVVNFPLLYPIQVLGAIGAASVQPAGYAPPSPFSGLSPPPPAGGTAIHHRPTEYRPDLAW